MQYLRTDSYTKVIYGSALSEQTTIDGKYFAI